MKIVVMKDAKYLLAYIVPAAVFAALLLNGWMSFAGIFVPFLILPIFELLMPGNTENFEEEEEMTRNKRWFFDVILYLNVPMIFTILWIYFSQVAAGTLMTYELVGLTASVGIYLGAMINVAHEMGHRKSTFNRVLSEITLMPSWYMHFIIEHNLGHHKNVSTDKDPASSKLNELIYTFYFRSTFLSYASAWKIQADILRKEGKAFLHYSNKMIWFTLIQIGYLATVFLVFGPLAAGLSIVIGILGFLMLETVNYIEHYGLRRKKLPSGRYEKVMPHHSWNSNHDIGRIFLYELTRHSDHHYKATRKYQVLRHFDESPQLPYGYPMSMLIALVPPLWFHLMNKEVERFMGRSTEAQQEIEMQTA